MRRRVEEYFGVRVLMCRPLHRRQGDHRPRPRPRREARGQLHRPPGLPHLPQLRRRHRLRLHLPTHGAPLRGLRQEVQGQLCGMENVVY